MQQQEFLLYVDAGLDTRPLLHFDCNLNFLFVDSRILQPEFQKQVEEVFSLFGFRKIQGALRFQRKQTKVFYFSSTSQVLSYLPQVTYCIVKTNFLKKNKFILSLLRSNIHWITYEQISEFDLGSKFQEADFTVLRSSDIHCSAAYVSYKYQTLQDFLDFNKKCS